MTKLTCNDPEEGCGTGFNVTVLAEIEVCVDANGNYTGIYDDSFGGQSDPFNGQLEIKEIIDVQCGCCGMPGDENES